MSGTTTLELPRGARSAGIARLIVTAHGAGLPSERLKSANLMVSELVSKRLTETGDFNPVYLHLPRESL